MRVVVFDLDHTLLTVNSSFRFGLFLYRQRYFSFWKLWYCLSAYMRHKWFGMKLQDLHVKAFTHLFQGQPLAAISHEVEKFLDEFFESILYAPVVKRLKLAQAQQEKVLILSSSPDFLVKAIAHRFQVQQWKATTYQVDHEGKFAAVSHVMEGENKANYLRQWVHQLQLSLSATTVYSDSYLDLPVLKIAGQVIGVVPDNRLKRLCQQKGWEIL